MCPKEDQPPSNTHSMSPTINDETKRPSTFAEPNCKHCHLKKQRNPSPENEWIPASFNECCAMLKMIAVVFILAADLYTTYFDDFKNLERTGIVLLFLDFMARRVFKTKEPEESLKI